MSTTEALNIAVDSIVSEVGCQAPSKAASFESLDIDSMDFLSILLSVEKKTGRFIPDRERVEMKTVEDLAISIWKYGQ